MIADDVGGMRDRGTVEMFAPHYNVTQVQINACIAFRVGFQLCFECSRCSERVSRTFSSHSWAYQFHMDNKYVKCGD
jgi:hypothetical protein